MTGKPVVVVVVVYLIRTSVIKKERFISFRADDLNCGAAAADVFAMYIF